MSNPPDISLDQLREMLRGNEMRRHTPSKGAKLYSPKSEVERYDSLGGGRYDQNVVSRHANALRFHPSNS